MDPKRKISWLCACAAVALISGCDGDPLDRVPKVAAQAPAERPAASDARGAGSDRASESARSADDAALNARVEAALDSEPELHGAKIGVRSDKGVVTLTGTAPDPRLRGMAAQVALSVDGVREVRNEIAPAQEA